MTATYWPLLRGTTDEKLIERIDKRIAHLRNIVELALGGASEVAGAAEEMLILEWAKAGATSSHSYVNGVSDTVRLDWLQSQLKHGWGDGFAMHPLDSGALYPRPWKKELEAKFEPDMKTGAWLWQSDIRTCIDEAIRRAYQPDISPQPLSTTGE